MDMPFSDFLLPDELLRAIDKLGFAEPTAVQQQVLPPAIEGKDLMVSAATGSGKTAAFLWPMMQRFLDNPSPRTGTRGLILVPTRELARQIRAHFMQLGSYTRLGAEAITGGESFGHQIATLRKNPEILIATPGRLLEHLERGAADLGDLEVLVLDEADRMLDMGFAEPVLTILGRCNPDRQSLLFSATLNHGGLKPITERLLRDPQAIVVNPKRERHPDIHHQILLADDQAHKQALLVWLLNHEDFDKALIFTNTREQASALGAFLQAEGQRAGTIHGELDQRERNRVMGLLRIGQIRILVGTDVAARGLDVPGIDLVVNVDIPRSGDDYLHRTGRTGRAGEQGLAITLVSSQEWNRMEGIQRYLHLDVKQRAIKGLEARFKGAPTRAKPGKRKLDPAARAKAAKAAKRAQTGNQPKPKDRARDRKNIGKRRKPTSEAATSAGTEAGFEPPKRRGS
jgi:ATP-dependent RNA helicase SrmB